MSRDDEQLDAAEYVIGTLSGAERAAFEILADSDAQSREDIGFWEKIFGLLNASLAPVIPPQHVWERISREIGEEPVAGLAVGTTAAHADGGPVAPVVPAPPMPGAGGPEAPRPGKVETGVVTPVRGDRVTGAAANDNIVKLRRSRSRWRWGAVAATIAAVALGSLAYDTGLRDTLVAKYLPGSALDSGKSYIAVVNTPDQPAMIVKVNGKTGEVSVRSIAVNRPEGKSYELWYVPEGEKAISVGLVGEGEINLGNTPAKDGDLLAISVEPSGGSPTGTATGPIIYTGKLIEDVDAE